MAPPSELSRPDDKLSEWMSAMGTAPSVPPPLPPLAWVHSSRHLLSRALLALLFASADQAGGNRAKSLFGDKRFPAVVVAQLESCVGSSADWRYSIVIVFVGVFIVVVVVGLMRREC